MLNSGPLRVRTNVILLFLTFGLGQGALLIAQTWLVFTSQLALVGQFGVSFTMATLAYYMVDWGGAVLLARQELADGVTETGDRLFWNLCVFRLGLALVYVAGVAIYGALTQLDFVSAYTLAAAPAIILGALNPAGLIDGLHRSGPNGFATAIPHFSSALVLVPMAGQELIFQGFVLGTTFTLATTAGLLFQYLVLRNARRLPTLMRPSLTGIGFAARDGGLILSTTVPTLVFYRIELAASMAILGPAVTGIFVYLRQILGAILQGAQFLRRAEFPGLVGVLQHGLKIRPALRRQKGSLLFVVVGSAAIATFGTLNYVWGWSGYSEQTFAFTLAYAVTLAVSGCYAATVQVAVALDRVGIAAAVTNIVVVVFAALTFPAVEALGLLAFPAVELGLNLFAFVGLIWFIRPRRRSRAVE